MGGKTQNVWGTQGSGGYAELAKQMWGRRFQVRGPFEVLRRESFCPQGTPGNMCRNVWLSKLGWAMLLASSE